jgi:hypothetical protein
MLSAAASTVPLVPQCGRAHLPRRAGSSTSRSPHFGFQPRPGQPTGAAYSPAHIRRSSRRPPAVPAGQHRPAVPSHDRIGRIGPCCEHCLLAKRQGTDTEIGFP